ncbi:MAG: site-specific DNA-methyltransferase, partial [Firmicutes bacterium]|nr:site-specific DNA-methyltransferase [Bacillota bacterium]
METPREKFQNLLRELFQFDCADLDFGIYRIMNHKRAVIERFIAEDLPKAITDALNREALAREVEAKRRLEEAARKVREALGAGALDAEGNLLEIYRGSPLGREYLELKEELATYSARPDREAEIYNHLFAFFSRYYQDGDFVAKRRYSRREKYAIPYNGEEIYLYWATQDQYYVKTGEYFRDYAFTAKGVTVHFRLEEANVEQDNVKGEKRFFLPRPDGMAWDEASSRFVIPFAYRPLTEEEEKLYGEKNQQEAINARALEEIPKRLERNPLALAALVEVRRGENGGKPVSNLEAHLRRYTRRNTADFFIHKDLKGFLTRELDFYLKNEVLNLDEMEAAGEERAEGWFQMMRVIRDIGGRIIEFLAQIEDFQKMLWEKRKFVTETQYCITIGNIPESFYPEIAACEAQWDEWKALFHIQEEQGVNLFTAGLDRRDRRIAFLKDHPTLVLDTRHFERDFVDRLLASFEDLDEATDGLLVHGENFQALNLLLEKYRGKVKCVYIDPPYNRGGDDFLYKDDYRHSSWLSMMFDRTRAAVPLLNRHGVLFVHIDENERDNLQTVLDLALGRRNRLEELIWIQNTTHSQSPLYSTNHEYVEVYACDRTAVEQDPVMFREPKPGYAELMALVERLNPAYPPISEVEREIQALMAQHLEEYKAELRAMGLEYDEETKKQDPWRGIYNYCHAEYRDAKGRLVAEEEARKRGAKLWIWREDNPSAPTQKQAESTRDPDDPNFRFYRPIHPKT